MVALGGLVALLAIGGIAMPWWWTRFTQRPALKRRAANVAAYKGRLQELEADVAAGILPAETVESTKAELGARLVQDADAPAPTTLTLAPSRAALVIAAVALVAFAGAWYAIAGSWRTQMLVELNKTNPEMARSAALDRMIEDLREQVTKKPEDAETWAWLGRSLGKRGSYTEAAQAYARANALKTNQDPDLLVEEGEAIAYSQDRRMSGAPAERFEQALALAPDHPQALWYAGIAALQAGDDRGAIARWERLVAVPGLADDMKATLEHSLSQLRARNGIKGPTPPAGKPAAPAGALVLNIEVDIAPALAAKVAEGDTLFVYAQDPNGPPMPLAVQRLPAGPFPVKTTLDDSMSPMPTHKLSSIDHWRVMARVSKAGSAMPQPGDFEGQIELSRKDAGKPHKVVIDRTR